jgi:hypothetical protein
VNRVFLRPLATLGAALALVVLPGCAARAPLSELEPGRASYALEEARAKFASSPNDEKARLRLGIALYDAGQYQEASTTLEPLVGKPSPDRRAILYHAAASEQLNNFEVAQRGYTAYLTAAGGDSPEVQARLAALKRRQAQRSAVEAVRREQELNVASFPEASITVTPFRIETADSSLAPLGYGLADLVTWCSPTSPAAGGCRSSSACRWTRSSASSTSPPEAAWSSRARRASASWSAPGAWSPGRW